MILPKLSTPLFILYIGSLIENISSINEFLGLCTGLLGFVLGILKVYDHIKERRNKGIQ